MGVPAGFTVHPGYVDMAVNHFPGVAGNQVTLIIIMGTAGMPGSAYWTNTVFNTEVIQELFKKLKRGKIYVIQLAKDCKFSYHNFVMVGMLFFTFLPNKILAPLALVSGKERGFTGEVRGSFFSVFCTLVQYIELQCEDQYTHRKIMCRT